MSRFVLVPSDRWLNHLVRGEADALDVGIMGCLVAVAQQQGGVGHREVVARLRDLHSQLNLSIGEKAFSDRLKKLRALGELSYATKQGQRRPWEITILPDDYFRAADARLRGLRELHTTKFEGGAALDFEETLYAPDTDGLDYAAGLGETSLKHRSPRSSLATDQTKVEERDQDHSRRAASRDARAVAEAIDASLASAALESERLAMAARRTGADRLLSLLPERHCTPSIRTGVTRRVEHLSPRAVDRVSCEFRNRLARGHIRKPAAYLYALLKRELRDAV